MLRTFLIYLAHRLANITSYSANDDIPYDRISMRWVERLLRAAIAAAVVVCCYSAIVSHLNLSVIVIHILDFIALQLDWTKHLAVFDVFLIVVQRKVTKHLINNLILIKYFKY